MRATPGAVGAARLAVASVAPAAEPTASREAVERPPPLDVGVRLGYARPVGAFDAGTRATDVSHGGAPLALDATWILPGARGWGVSAGLMGSWAKTIPKLCGSFDECTSSLGTDTELLAIARFRAPRLAFVLPEAEIGAGWGWSSRTLASGDASSTRRWSGPVIVRAAIVPTFVLGERTRLGVVVGGSLAQTATFELEAPGVEERNLEGARLHGTVDLAVRFAIGLL
jgi:hypothetical protein